MKILKFTLCALFLSLSSSFVNAQEIETKKIKRIAIAELYVQPGLLIQSDRSLSPNNYLILNPSPLLSKFDNYEFSNGISISSNLPTFTGLIGIKFRNKEKQITKQILF